MEIIEERIIKCSECGKEFTMSPAEQKFYQKKGYTLPKRCYDCRMKEKEVKQFTCVDCGATFELTGTEIKYYEKNGLILPKRCKKCREFKKEKNLEVAFRNK